MPIRALSTAATGMLAQQTNVDTIANNIANVSTTGFKRQRAAFEDLFYQTIRPAGRASAGGNRFLPTPIELGTGVRFAGTDRTFTQGSLDRTDNPFDIAVQGEGFFQIELQDGTTAYTRDGSFHVDADGNIVTSDGYFLQDAGTVPQDARATVFGPTGTVDIVQPDGTLQNIGQIELATFINPQGLEAIGDNVFLETDASGAAQLDIPGDEDKGVVRQGFLELSNVEVVTELVNLIRAQRAFEVNANTIQAGNEMLQTANNLRR